MSPISSLSRLALLQVLVVAVGVLVTCGMLKLYGYPDFARHWNPVSLGVRHSGYLLLFVPAVWTFACLGMERRITGVWTRRWSLASGFILLVVLAGGLWWTSFTPYYWSKGDIPLLVP